MTDKMKAALEQIELCYKQIDKYERLLGKAYKEYDKATREYAFTTLGIKKGDKVILNDDIKWWSEKLCKTVIFKNIKVIDIVYKRKEKKFFIYGVPYSDDWKTSYGTRYLGATRLIDGPENIKEIL